ncbi:ankyrin repeat domain-containing protein [Actinokineospora terrae]|uniref:Uncharacterized protein n=1 Tax=Actinokineospora terrae TaxID=155974 RepID=A0A1H9WUC4_9PSEU|nr:ankyrin repeat domain-containing protein [Actinokineospora terrae]SES37391.1 hypothetical protein SAMN04487818_111214 [Actinokineospora terrae]
MPIPTGDDLARSPHLVTEFASPADEFLAHACLTYGGDDEARVAHAGDLLAAHPGIDGIAVAVVLGDVARVRSWIERDPEAATAQTGPFAWEPLLYLTYGRFGGGDPVGVAEALLAAGADPNSGYLWEGLPSPFTALTGCFGRGEGDQPPHPDGLALARVLLVAGADPNDNQTLYNRQFRTDDDHLRLLFEFGLGRGAPRWPMAPEPARMLHDVLLWAASTGQRDRVALLLEHGVDPDPGIEGHPIHRGATPLALAERAGHTAVADLLRP